MKEIVVTSSAIACAAVGFVMGFALINQYDLSLAAYGHLWVFVTACLSAAFVVGLMSEFLVGKFRTPSTPPQTGTGIQNFRRSIAQRFRGDRTDEEYQRAETGFAVLVAIASIIGMLFLTGIWVIVAVVIIFGMIKAAELYLEFRSIDGGTGGKISRALFHGIFYGLFLGYML